MVLVFKSENKPIYYCGLPASPASFDTAASDCLNVLTSSSMSSSSVSCFLTSDLVLPSASPPLSVELDPPVKLPLFSTLGDSALVWLLSGAENQKGESVKP